MSWKSGRPIRKERGLAASITVEVTDVNEAPSEPVEFFGGFAISGLHEVLYEEHDTIMVARYEGVRLPIGTQVIMGQVWRGRWRLRHQQRGCAHL